MYGPNENFPALILYGRMKNFRLLIFRLGKLERGTGVSPDHGKVEQPGAAAHMGPANPVIRPAVLRPEVARAGQQQPGGWLQSR